ncbi:hypothetical protein CONLIGDRAFT_679100 [Coniochaeta ligniaria NRRL 30616]|uniref:Zn(2)-C6 fungal-type domain-containing protein n=1 Tax=Coniochaeta ligniaria NRRL 30616 TaxID=1408157 RepID=A0A1J7JRV9_9PEZI|nr:hypothetical protein CONLIGDRAFT_679100 [Coniochaeta ligniaria NRRL 30616]
MNNGGEIEDWKLANDAMSASSVRLSKRKRTSRACDQCRERKQKCDGHHPICTSCTIADLSCKYGHVARKRGLPVGYVRSLELLWALLFSVVPRSEEVVNNLLREIEFETDSGGNLAISSNAIKVPKHLRRVWTDSGVQTKLERQLSRLDPDADDDSVVPEDVERPISASAKNPLVPGSLLFEPFQVSSASTLLPGLGSTTASIAGRRRDEIPRQHTNHNWLGFPSDGLSDGHHSSLSNRTALPLPSNSRRLLDIYFSYTHCWLPVVKKHTMLEILFSYPMTESRDSGNLATFWAVLAYASLQDPARHMDAMSVDECDADGARLTADRVYAQARSLIPDEDGVAKVGYAIALLILSLCKTHVRAWTSAWCLVGQAVRALLVSHGSWDLEENTRRSSLTDMGEDRNLALLSCFVIDTLLSCQLGVPPHLRTADILNVVLPLETGMDEWEAWTASYSYPNHTMGFHEPARILSIFNRKVELMRILNDIGQEQNIESRDHDGSRHRLSLRHWLDNLPQHCAVVLEHKSQDAITQRLSPQLLNLRLAFEVTELALSVKYGTSVPWPSPRQPLTEPTHLAIHRLLSHSESLFSQSFVPAVFTIYKDLEVRETSRLTSSGSHTGALNTTSKDHVSPPFARSTFSAFKLNGISGTHDTTPTTIPPLTDSSTPTSQSLTQLFAGMPLGYEPTFTDGPLPLNHALPGDLHDLHDMCVIQSSDFLQNLGFRDTMLDSTSMDSQ